ncbi:hypothetical protein [Xenorhabdus bovienii]|uniref:hypothetical protein n=1 Tax=Xenorhabdus bovienii TaxID=40576 RepID=UPI00215799F9|nr:hypothetical protein [Xenorhabdus bovienii]
MAIGFDTPLLAAGLFIWRNPLSELGLYQAGKFNIQANGAYFTLSVTFTRVYHP